MKRIVLLTAFLTVAFIGSTLQAQICAKVTLSFQAKVPAWLAENDVPAAGIGVIENGKIKFVKVFGQRQKGVPAPDNAIFNIASITKTTVTMLTLKLVETGQWNLDEPLSNYWVDPDVADDSLHKKLTTRHVLTHQTGFGNWRWNHPTKKLTFDFEPGTKFQYSGEGFEYLRRALEKKFNKSLEKLLDSIIFKPIGMKDTKYWDKNVDMQRYARWHDSNGTEYNKSYQTGVCAADLLLTTIEDYCKFEIFVINGAGLSSSLFNDMITPHSNIKGHTAYGLGWSNIKGLPNGEYALYHGGSDPAVKTMAILLPNSKRGVVIFTNGDNGMSVFNNVIKEVFENGDSIYNYIYERPNIPKIIDIPNKILEKYVGRYQQPGGSVNVISKKGNEIILSGGGWPKTIFYSQAENKFFMREFDTQIEFVKDETGVITKMIIFQNGNKYTEAKRLE